MTIKKAMEVLGIDGDISNLTESTLKEQYRRLLMLYHPDLIRVNNSPLSVEELEAITKELNEAYGELCKIITPKEEKQRKKNKSKEEFDNYANNLIRKLQEKYYSYLSNNIIGKDIQKIINTVILYREIFSEDYVEFDKKYQQATELIEQLIKKTKSPSIEYITNKVEDLRKKYLGKDRNKKENIEINNILNELLLNKSAIMSVLDFDEKVNTVISKIEKILDNYYNSEFSKLEQLYQPAFLKFPNSKTAFVEVKLNNSDIKTTADTDKVLFDAKVAVNSSIKNSVNNNLNIILEKYKKDKNYKFVENKIKEIFNVISSKTEVIVNTSWNYERAFTNEVEDVFILYKRLLEKKGEIISNLTEFNDNPIASKYLKQLNQTNDYDSLDTLIRQCEQLLGSLKQESRMTQSEETKNTLMAKLSRLDVKSLNKNMKIMQQVVELLEKYQSGLLDIDIDKLKQINFSNYKQDLKIIAEACSKVNDHQDEQDYDLITSYFDRRNVARK